MSQTGKLEVSSVVCHWGGSLLKIKGNIWSIRVAQLSLGCSHLDLPIAGLIWLHIILKRHSSIELQAPTGFYLIGFEQWSMRYRMQLRASWCV